MSRRENMDYNDINLTLPLRLSAPPQIAWCSWGAVNWNQVSLADCWHVTLLLPLRRLLTNVPSHVFIRRPVPEPPPPSLPFLSSFRSRVVTEAKEKFTAEGIILNCSADGDDHLFLNHLCRCSITAFFRRKARAHGTQNPLSPPLTEICAHSNQQKIQWGFTHMLITNLYAFLCYCWTLLSLFKPRKLNHLDAFTTDGTGWTTSEWKALNVLQPSRINMGLWVAQGINNSKPITCPSKLPILFAHLGWLMYPHSSEMGSSGPSSSTFDEQVCPVASGEIPSSRIFFGFGDFFLSNQAPFRQDISRTIVHLQLQSRNRKNSEQACWWLVHKGTNTHAWGQRGVSLHVTWWWQQVGFQLVEITEWHGVTHSVRSRRYQALAYLRESTITMRLRHSWIFLLFIVQYFHLPGMSMMWIFFFLVLSDVKKLKCGV